MKVTRTEIADVLIIEPRVFEDARGIFFESYNKRSFTEATGVEAEFVQDNVSRSVKNVIRGLHYQAVKPQGKLIRCISGRIFDVAVDIRRSSRTFKRWVGFELSGSQPHSAWIPPGFAHGFLVLSESAEVQYKVTDFWYPEHERTLLWNDADVAVRWPLSGVPVLNPRDAAAPGLVEALGPE